MPTSDDETTVAPLQENMRKPNLTSQERRDIVQALLLMVVPGDPELKLVVGAIKSLSDTYHVDRKTIRNIWQRAVANFFDPNIKSLISSPKKKGNSGRPQKWVRGDVRDAVSSLPLNKRRTIRSIASALEIPKSTLFRMKGDMDDQVLRAFVEFEPRMIDCGFLTLQTCLNDMMEVNGGNDYKIRHLGKQALLREFGSIPRSFRATDEALQVYQLFTGDGGEIHDSGDDNSDAGAGDGAVDQVIISIQAM